MRTIAVGTAGNDHGQGISGLLGEFESRAFELAATSSLGPDAKKAIEWLAGHLETVVLLGFIILVIYAWATAGP